MQIQYVMLGCQVGHQNPAPDAAWQEVIQEPAEEDC